MRCHHCGTDLPPEANVCPACGTPAPNAGETDLDRTFATIYRRIEAHPPEPGLDKDAAVEVVREIEREAARGEEIDPDKIEAWLKSLAFIAPDILAITVTGLAGSESDINAVIREIARTTREGPDAG